MSIASPSHLTFASKSNIDLNQSEPRVIYWDLPEAVSPSMLASSASITNRSVGAHSGNLDTSDCGISDEASRACTLVRAIGVHAIGVCATASNSLAALVNIIASLALECVINSCWHVKPLGMVAVVTWWAGLASKTGRQVCAADSRIAWLNQVALKWKRERLKINNALPSGLNMRLSPHQCLGKLCRCQFGLMGMLHICSMGGGQSRCTAHL